TLYTPHLGKIQGFAKSLRKPKSKMAGHLESLTHSTVTLARGRNIDTITGAQTINSFLPLKTDLDLTSYALYVIELVDQFTAEHIENYPLFQLLLDTLERLSHPVDKDLVLRHFEMHLLESVGYRPQLQHCPACRTALQPVANSFSPAIGGVLCPDCSRTQALTTSLSVNAQKVLKLLQGDDYDTVSRLKMPADLTSELEAVMRAYLRYLLEREVKSAAWLDMLKG
ncbi:MAG TPA: DNA repair protein RecO, partial [Dehalococcoidales bacterium]|nr:DNA repair protein RecO [Dehalococcoidales bacterium]